MRAAPIVDTDASPVDTVGSEIRSTGSGSPRETVATALTALAILCGVALRWVHLGSQSLWYDEGQTEFAAKFSPADIVRFVRSTDHPPLYFLLEHYWTLLFGNSETALRALSAVFGTASLAVFYFFAKKLLKDKMAVALAMWLFAFSMMQLWYSQEARSYELISLLGLVSLYALVMFLDKRSAGLFVVIVLTTTVSLYTHNMFAFYALALNVTWLTFPSERTRWERLKELALADVIIGLLYLPWVPSLLSQANADVVEKVFWAPQPTLWTLLGTLRLVTGFNTEYLSWLPGRVLPLSAKAALPLVVGAILVACAASVGGGLWRVSRTDRDKNLSLMLYGLIPIGLVFGLSHLTTPLFIDRIFIDSSVVIAIVLAFPLALRKQRYAQLAYRTVGIMLAAATALSGFGYLRYQQKDDWRGATASLLRAGGANRLVVFIPRMGEPVFDYYARRSPLPESGLTKFTLPRSYVDTFPPPERSTIDADDIERLKKVVERGNYAQIDLVLSHEWRDDPNDLVLDYLSHTLALREEDNQFAGIRIVRFVPRPH